MVTLYDITMMAARCNKDVTPDMDERQVQYNAGAQAVIKWIEIRKDKVRENETK